MPKKSTKPKVKKSSQVIESDDEFVDEGVQKGKNDISDLERERLVGDLMRLVIFSDLHKTSVTKRDISMKVTKEYSGKRNITNEVIEEAQRRFRDIFGFEWKELPKTVVTRTGKMKTKSIDTSQKSGKFILLNKLPDNENLLTWEANRPLLGLLMIVLSIIHLNNNVVEQETLYSLLTHLGLDEHTAIESAIPNWVDLVEKKFVKQMYLEREKIPERTDKNGREVYEYRIGIRSKLEIPTLNIMRFVADVFGEELSDIQLKEAASEENLEASDAEMEDAE